METYLLIEVTDIPMLSMQGRYEGLPCTYLVPDLEQFTPADWQRVERYYQSIGFPDHVASGRFTKYVHQVLRNLRDGEHTDAHDKPTTKHTPRSQTPGGRAGASFGPDAGVGSASKSQ